MLLRDGVFAGGRHAFLLDSCRHTRNDARHFVGEALTLQTAKGGARFPFLGHLFLSRKSPFALRTFWGTGENLSRF